jgi:hypothetical protein
MGNTEMAPVGTRAGDWRFRFRVVCRELGRARGGYRFFVSYHSGAGLNLVVASASPRGVLAKSSISIIRAIDTCEKGNQAAGVQLRGGRMERTLVFALVIFIACGSSASAQTSECSSTVPEETVEALWNMAARGELLTPKGWDRASSFFAQPGPVFGGRVVQVMSDYFGVNRYSIEGSTATVDMEYTDLGEIDSALRYKPPPETNAYKTSIRYKLVSGPKYLFMYGPDGKTLVDKKEVTGQTVWRIEASPHPPWTTVNGAIRYVLEVSQKTADPAVRKNAEATLAELMKLH